MCGIDQTKKCHSEREKKKYEQFCHLENCSWKYPDKLAESNWKIRRSGIHFCIVVLCNSATIPTDWRVCMIKFEEKKNSHPNTKQLSSSSTVRKKHISCSLINKNQSNHSTALNVGCAKFQLYIIQNINATNIEATIQLESFCISKIWYLICIPMVPKNIYKNVEW